MTSPLPDGIINIRKSAETRSFSVIETLKSLPGVSKAGYVGTLDNFASGVLLCGINRATKILKYLLELDKEYEAVVKLGVTTDTLDPQGTVVAEGRSDYSQAEIASAASGFAGTYLQTPPDFSSKKIAGQRASDLVRRGTPVVLKPSRVTVYSLSVDGFQPGSRFVLKVRCSTGTYIRALARDIAQKLGTVAMLEKLDRTSNGRFLAADGVSPEEVNLERDLIPLSEALYFLDKTELKAEARGKVKNGVPLAAEDLNSGNLKNGVYRLIFNELLLSIIEIRNGRFLYLDNFSADI